jgi:hypothetical protein
MVAVVAKLSLEEFEAYISDRVTQIAFEKATNKITDKQALAEMADLARWCVDRMRQLSQRDQLKVMQSRLFEAIGPKE